MDIEYKLMILNEDTLKAHQLGIFIGGFRKVGKLKKSGHIILERMRGISSDPQTKYERALPNPDQLQEIESIRNATISRYVALPNQDTLAGIVGTPVVVYEDPW